MGVQHNGTSAGERTVAGARIVVSESSGTKRFAEEASRLLAEAGCTILPCPAIGAESDSEQQFHGKVNALLETSVAELADGALDGVLQGRTRLEIAAPLGIPMVVVPGDLDSVRFASRETVPARFGRRRFHTSESDGLLMRVDVGDSAHLGRLLAEKLNAVTGPVAVCLPLRGLSALGAPGEPMRWMEADMAFFGNLTTHLRRDILLRDSNTHINDPEFAHLCVASLIELLTARSPASS